MQRRPDSVYCFYHEKLSSGLCEPHIDSIGVEVDVLDEKTGKVKGTRRQVVSRTRSDCYPVLPLPKNGYVILLEQQQQQAA